MHVAIARDKNPLWISRIWWHWLSTMTIFKMAQPWNHNHHPHQLSTRCISSMITSNTTLLHCTSCRTSCIPTNTQLLNRPSNLIINMGLSLETIPFSILFFSNGIPIDTSDTFCLYATCIAAWSAILFHGLFWVKDFKSKSSTEKSKLKKC